MVVDVAVKTCPVERYETAACNSRRPVRSRLCRGGAQAEPSAERDAPGPVRDPCYGTKWLALVAESSRFARSPTLYVLPAALLS
jgi:hypothetical protein